MTDADRREFLQASLARFGDPRTFPGWETGEVDYVKVLELTAADVPELLAIARKWAEPMDWPDDDDYVAGYAPIHAWRGLAQLGAADAVGPLLEMLDPLDVGGDDWFLEEFPHVLAWIGPTAVPALRDYLADSAHEVFARVCIAHSLQEIAARHPQTREAVVSVLTGALSHFSDTDPGVNAYLITALLDLNASEAAELIEKAHAADCVDVSVNGNWNSVREQLGVPGLGLVPEHLASQKWGWASEPDAEYDDDKEEALPFDDSRGPIRASEKIGRNEPCPCGSGKKYKKCCGR